MKQYPEIVGIRTDWWDADGTWKAYGDNEAIWTGVDGMNRHVCQLKPADYSEVKIIRFMKRPFDEPEAEWVEFGRAENGVPWTMADFGVGNWLVGVEVHFKDGTIRRTRKPEK